jgi:hypothetical protein
MVLATIPIVTPVMLSTARAANPAMTFPCWRDAATDVQGEAAVSSVSARQGVGAFAAGFKLRRGIFSPLILRYSNGSWIQERVHTVGPSRLDGVALISSHSAWAIGTAQPLTGYLRPIAVHWNGLAWQQVTLPTISRTFTTLSSISATGDRNVWAVGNSQTRTQVRAIAEHWDGRTWRLEVIPGVTGRAAYLSDVMALPDGEVWAVGSVISAAGERPLLLQRTSHRWKPVAVPQRINSGAFLGLWASKRAILTVGYSAASTGVSSRRALVARWDGHGWETDATFSRPAQLTSLTVSKHGEVTAVGYKENGGVLVQVGGARRLLQTVATPHAGPRGQSALFGVSTLGRQELAVGAYVRQDGTLRPLLMRTTVCSATAARRR